MQRIISSLIIAQALLVGASFGAVSLYVGGGVLKNSDGTTPSPDTTLVVVVADTAGDGFDVPTPGDFLGGSDDDIVIDVVSLSAPGFLGTTLASRAFGDDGVARSGSFTSSGGWGTGDQVGIYWFPSLVIGSFDGGASTASANVAAGLQYGFFTDGSWTTPSDGVTAAFDNGGFLVFDPASSVDVSNFPLSNGVSVANTTLVANLTVIPEPTSALLSLFGLPLLFVRRRR